MKYIVLICVLFLGACSSTSSRSLNQQDLQKSSFDHRPIGLDLR